MHAYNKIPLTIEHHSSRTIVVLDYLLLYTPLLLTSLTLKMLEAIILSNCVKRDSFSTSHRHTHTLLIRTY